MHAGNIDNDTNEGRLYRFLRARSGYWFTTKDLIREVGVCNPATHKSGIQRELRERGAFEEIEHRQEGRLHYYRHVYTPAEAVAYLYPEGLEPPVPCERQPGVWRHDDAA